tara:strand:- start:193 stop:456 length:264 start_codon:yes stop_codon:yes gene_type:complete
MTYKIRSWTQECGIVGVLAAIWLSPGNNVAEHHQQVEKQTKQLAQQILRPSYENVHVINHSQSMDANLSVETNNLVLAYEGKRYILK